VLRRVTHGRVARSSQVLREKWLVGATSLTGEFCQAGRPEAAAGLYLRRA